MMRLRSAIAISCLALTSQLYSVAEASPSTCWFQQRVGAKTSPPSECDVTRIGGPGDVTYRVLSRGVSRIITIESNQIAWVVFNGMNYRAKLKFDNERDHWLTFPDGSWFVFRVPRSQGG